MVKIERAIISVSDKEGIVDFSKKLVDRGVEIVSTGGTAFLLEKNGIKARQVSEVTGFPATRGVRTWAARTLAISWRPIS